MPAYNCSEYIGEAIESVQKQTFSNWELIIVDDCSSDNTCSVIKYYIDTDVRIHLIKQTHNGGVVKARNTALNIAKGQFVAFLDSDDKWKKDKLQKQLEFMKSNGYAFTFTAYEYMKDNSNKINKVVHAPNHQSYRQGLKNTIIGCLTVMVDRNQTGAFYMPELLHGEDHFTWLGLMKKGFYAYGLDECLSEYRVSNNSLSANKVKALKLQWNNYRSIANLPLYSCIYYFGCYVFNAMLKRI
ncbi:glycosyltransferase family 2 protein [Gottfriedia acidiceleris]|uniref:glycosyltransferase family 2 protein n=1 Tax=Gottfriedia acidiceleris TaxID=371036 RepID=UPI003B586895